MFPTQADYHFFVNRNKPSWFKGNTGLAPVSPDALVNSHAGIRIANYLHNTLSVFRLWQSNRINEGVSHEPVDFMRYIVAGGPSNQKARFNYCNRALRKLAKKTLDKPIAL